MKKKSLCTMLIAAIMMSMTGCGGNTDTPAVTEGGDVTTTAAVEESTAAVETTTAVETTVETTTTTAETTVETTTTKKEKPKELLNVGGIHYTMNDHIVVAVNENFSTSYYVYDSVNDTLSKKFDMDISASVGNIGIFCSGHDKRRIALLDKGRTIVTANDDYLIFANNIYSGLRAGEPLIVSNIPVGKLEESFSGNIMNFGLLGTDGEWLYEMSGDYSICKGDVISTNALEGANYYGFGESMLIEKDNKMYAYSFKTDILKEVGTATRPIALVALTEDYAIINLGNELIKYDEKTGEIETLYTAKGHKITCYATDTYVKISDGSEPTRYLIDTKTFKLCSYDFSEYTDASIIGGNENFVAFEATNPNGDIYIIVMDKDGNMITDPIKGTLFSVNGIAAFERENCYIIGCDGDTYIIDKATGEIQEWYIRNYVHKSGLAFAGEPAFGNCFLFNVDTGKRFDIYK